MPTTITPVVFATQSPPWNLAQLDGNFSAVAAALASPSSGISVGTDIGAVNALVVNPTPAWPSYQVGAVIAVTVGNNNTSSSVTLNVSSLGAAHVINTDGSSLVPNQLIGASTYLFLYQGANIFEIVGSTALVVPQSVITAIFPNPATDLENLVINGEWRVSQVNGSSAATVAANTTNLYTHDQWSSSTGPLMAMTVQQATSASTGGGLYYGSFGVTISKSILSSTDIGVTYTPIEGLNIAKLDWGSVNARPVTLQFRFMTSVANAVLNIAFRNGNVSTANRSYVTQITTGTANTWASYSVTVPGDTAGTWSSSNVGGLFVYFSWANGISFNTGTPNTWVGTNSLGTPGGTNFFNSTYTWGLTDVDLKAGTLLLPITRRQYATELALCQRYLPYFASSNTTSYIGSCYCNTANTSSVGLVGFPVPTRVPITAVVVSAGTHFAVNYAAGVFNSTSLALTSIISLSGAGVDAVTASGPVAGQGGALYFNTASGFMYFTGAQL